MLAAALAVVLVVAPVAVYQEFFGGDGWRIFPESVMKVFGDASTHPSPPPPPPPPPPSLYDSFRRCCNSALDFITSFVSFKSSSSPSGSSDDEDRDGKGDVEHVTSSPPLHSFPPHSLQIFFWSSCNSVVDLVTSFVSFYYSSSDSETIEDDENRDGNAVGNKSNYEHKKGDEEEEMRELEEVEEAAPSSGRRVALILSWSLFVVAVLVMATVATVSLAMIMPLPTTTTMSTSENTVMARMKRILTLLVDNLKRQLTPGRFSFNAATSSSPPFSSWLSFLRSSYRFPFFRLLFIFSRLWVKVRRFFDSSLTATKHALNARRTDRGDSADAHKADGVLSRRGYVDSIYNYVTKLFHAETKCAYENEVRFNGAFANCADAIGDEVRRDGEAKERPDRGAVNAALESRDDDSCLVRLPWILSRISLDFEERKFLEKLLSEKKRELRGGSVGVTEEDKEEEGDYGGMKALDVGLVNEIDKATDEETEESKGEEGEEEGEKMEMMNEYQIPEEGDTRDEEKTAGKPKLSEKSLVATERKKRGDGGGEEQMGRRAETEARERKKEEEEEQRTTWEYNDGRHPHDARERRGEGKVEREKSDDEDASAAATIDSLGFGGRGKPETNVEERREEKRMMEKGEGEEGANVSNLAGASPIESEYIYSPPADCYFCHNNMGTGDSLQIDTEERSHSLRLLSDDEQESIQHLIKPRAMKKLFVFVPREEVEVEE